MDAVAADGLQQVHDCLAVAPGVHEQGVEAGIVGSHPQPQHVTVDTFQFTNEFANSLGAQGYIDFGQPLDADDVSRGVDVGTDATDAFQQVDILRPVVAFGALLDAAVGVAQAHGGRGHRLALDGELEVARFLQRRVLRPDGDDEAVRCL